MNSLAPAIDTTFVGIQSRTVAVINTTNSAVNYTNLVTTGLTPNLALSASSADAITVGVSSARTFANQGTVNKATLVSNMALLKNELDNIANNVSLWGPPSAFLSVPGFSSQYRLKNAVSILNLQSSSNATNTAAQNAPTGATIAVVLSSQPDMSIYSGEIRTLISFLENDIRARLLDGSTGKNLP